MALCIKDAHERGGERCESLVDTKIASYEMKLPPPVLQRENRVECVIKALVWLEAKTEMREEGPAQ